MKAKHIVISAIVLALGYGAWILYLQMQLLKTTCIKMVGYQLQGIATQSASLTITLSIKNNSDINLLARNGNFDIFINDNYIANVPIKVAKTIASNSTIQLPVTAYFNPKEVIKKGLQAIVSSGSNARVTLRGSIGVISNVIAVNNIKVDQTLTLNEILQSTNSPSKC